MRDVKIETDRKTYAPDETVPVIFSFRIIGGLRESFHPDVWTRAWEDYDKILRLTYRVRIGERRGLRPKNYAEVKKAVRRASFYWSRDPDLPYRIWAMIMPEDGGAPQIPLSVEDAKSKMLDVSQRFQFRASSLGKGAHSLSGSAEARWGRRSFIEKGTISGESKPLVVTIE
jgi:hypothetical protein